MGEREHILKELKLARDGDPWHGSSRAAVLADVTLDEATREAGRARWRPRDAALGSGVTYREMLHGLAQHDAYHSGQIALLKRIYR